MNIRYESKKTEFLNFEIFLKFVEENSKMCHKIESKKRIGNFITNIKKI